MNLFPLSILLCFVYFIVILNVENAAAKGGRGGGARIGGGSRSGGFRSSISRTGSNIGNSGGGSGIFRSSQNGNSRFSGSSFNRYSAPSSYGRSGIRWSSFGAGMVAYGIMSSLATRGYYRGGGYYHRNGENYSPIRKGSSGNVCINNEDFNGTVFGEFACPLPEFDPSAKYCCGSYENQTQYCCNFFDEYKNKAAIFSFSFFNKLFTFKFNFFTFFLFLLHIF